MSGKKDDRTTVYHHTSRDGAKAILKDGKIKQSDSRKGDAAYGSGTYVTELGPSHSKDHIARNNYDGLTRHWERQRDQGKADVAIEVKIPKQRLEPAHAPGRNVYKAHGDIKLPPDTKIHVRDPHDDSKYSTYQMH